MSGPMGGTLDVRSREGRDDVVLPPTSTRYRIVEAIVHHALCLLETEQGRQSLATVATEIIKEREEHARPRRRPAEHIFRDSLANMPHWIRTFLYHMRRNFPPICIAPSCSGEAQAEKYDWGDDMTQYDAGAPAGVLYMSGAIIDNMTYVRQQSPRTAGNSYDMFKFQMTVSVAHEIVHFLTGFITGTAMPNTPPGITTAPYGGRNNGEAGRYWEVMFLGGILEFYSSASDPLGVRQAGRPYLFAGGREGDTGREVSMSYVQEFIDGDFTFPIRASSQSAPVTRRRLQPSKETSTLRRSTAHRNAGRVESPDPDDINAGPNVRYRSIIISPEPGYFQTGGSSRRYYR